MRPPVQSRHTPGGQLVPLVHMNGTAASDLISDTLEAAHALNDGIRKLQAACPNARDYYQYAADAFAEASNQHASRLRSIQSVIDQLTEIVVDIDAQQNPL